MARTGQRLTFSKCFFRLSILSALSTVKKHKVTNA
jgi:hypothetical protein